MVMYYTLKKKIRVDCSHVVELNGSFAGDSVLVEVQWPRIYKAQSERQNLAPMTCLCTRLPYPWPWVMTVSISTPFSEPQK